MPDPQTVLLHKVDTTRAYMPACSARRHLLTFLNYADPTPATTLRLVCFSGCTLHDLRPLLAPFGVALRNDGTGSGHTPAGLVRCQAVALGGPRPVVTLWKALDAERVLLGGVWGASGVWRQVPVGVFKDVLWPVVREGLGEEEWDSGSETESDIDADGHVLGDEGL